MSLATARRPLLLGLAALLALAPLGLEPVATAQSAPGIRMQIRRPSGQRENRPLPAALTPVFSERGWECRAGRQPDVASRGMIMCRREGSEVMSLVNCDDPHMRHGSLTLGVSGNQVVTFALVCE